MLNRLDPMTYAVDPMRRLVFAHLSHVSPAARAALDPGSRGGAGGFRGARSRVVLALGLVMLGIAIWEFAPRRGAKERPVPVGRGLTA